MLVLVLVLARQEACAAAAHTCHLRGGAAEQRTEWTKQAADRTAFYFSLATRRSPALLLGPPGGGGGGRPAPRPGAASAPPGPAPHPPRPPPAWRPATHWRARARAARSGG
jgi:hypothetical protein